MSPARPAAPSKKPDFHPNPIPLDHSVPRFCHLCGKKLKTKYVSDERRRRLVCGHCGTVAYLNPRVVAGALPVKNGKVLLLVRGIPPRKGYWTFPGGFVELGETVSAGAVRETREEVKMRVAVESLLGAYSYPFTGTVVVVYSAKVLSGKGTPTSEALEVGWFKPSEIPWDQLAFHSTRDALTDWLRQTGSSVKPPKSPKPRFHK